MNYVEQSGIKYVGSPIETLGLSDDTKSRIEDMVSVASNAGFSEVQVLKNEIPSDELDQFGNNYNEILEFDGGKLQHIYFIENNTNVELLFYSRGFSRTMREIEDALDLDIIERPISKQSPGRIERDGKPFEVVEELDHSSAYGVYLGLK